jgi:hypothetical protein
VGVDTVESCLAAWEWMEEEIGGGIARSWVEQEGMAVRGKGTAGGSPSPLPLLPW